MQNELLAEWHEIVLCGASFGSMVSAVKRHVKIGLT
jgi:hypothetical protein